MNMRLISVLALDAVIATSTSCTTVSRGLGKITANKYASARSGTVWTIPPPLLSPPPVNQRVAYISFRNISDASEINLKEQIVAAAETQGWTLTDDPAAATYRLRASLRFFGEVDPESGGKDIANKMGWIAGAATGVGTYALVQSQTDNWAAGAAAGAAAGGLVGMGISNASKPREWAAIIDFVLEERSDEPVTFELATDSSTNASSGSGVGNSRMSDGGGTSSGNSSVATASKTSDYYPHAVRLSSWANQMNMSEEEALPLIQERISKVVTQMLPQ